MHYTLAVDRFYIAAVSVRIFGLTFSIFLVQQLRAQPASAPPAPVLSSDFPHLVPEPPTGLTSADQQPWFDTFSWQEFIALNWPAVDGQRGVAKNPNDVMAFRSAFAQSASGDYPEVVWGSWKQAYELFEQGSVRPTVWSSFAAVLPCVNPLPTVPKTFLDAMNLDINQSFSRPLIDQKRNYTRYEIRINEAEYNLIRGDDNAPTSWLYITTNFIAAQPINFPSSTNSTLGVVEVKAAWKQMTSSDDPKRYYVVNALVLVDPQTKAAQYQKMGLVGFHIAHKTSPFKEWVWSTFEHVDNVTAPTGTTPSYNNGTSSPATPNGFDTQAPLFLGTFIASPVSQQVTRVNPIFTTPAMQSTADLNAAFQNLLAGTVWQNYQLISTQWPTQPAQFKFPGAGPTAGKYPGDCGLPFPSTGIANTVVETYDQAPTTLLTGNSCMSCHYQAARADFSWVLQDRHHLTIAPTNQADFLNADRFVSERALKTISNLNAADRERATPIRQSLENISARQKEAR